MEHTPGPWHSQWSKTLGITGYDILGPNDVAIAGICDMVGSPLPLAANARLIAAAPEMLEALENTAGRLRAIAERVAADCEEGDWADELDTIIKKACQP